MLKNKYLKKIKFLGIFIVSLFLLTTMINYEVSADVFEYTYEKEFVQILLSKETLDETQLEEIIENTQPKETADLISDEVIEQDSVGESILEETKVDQEDEIPDSDSELIEDEPVEEIFSNPEIEVENQIEKNTESQEETLYTTTPLYIRPYKEAQTNIGVLPKGTAVTGYKDGVWFRFIYQGQEAYIALRWTSTEAPPVKETLYTTTPLYIRPYKGAQTNIGVLPKGTAVTGYKDGVWFRFIYQGQEAYIAARYLKNISDISIYIDPGHGGSDSGAYYYGIREADLNLKVSHMVKDGLVKLGYKVLMPRTSDTYIDYLDRAIDANAKNPDLFVSIHHNAAQNWPNATGIETYYYQYHPNWPPKINQEMHNDPNRIQKSASLATDIQNALINATGAVNRGVQRNTFLVLRETKMPAALVELGFMSNYSELQKLLNSSYQRVMANAIVKGIHNQFIK